MQIRSNRSKGDGTSSFQAWNVSQKDKTEKQPVSFVLFITEIPLKKHPQF